MISWSHAWSNDRVKTPGQTPQSNSTVKLPGQPPCRALHYIKLTDTTTGVGHIDLNRISGYLPGKMVVLLMNVGGRGRFWECCAVRGPSVKTLAASPRGGLRPPARARAAPLVKRAREPEAKPAKRAHQTHGELAEQPNPALCQTNRNLAGPQVCKSGLARARKIWLTRHGESEYNQAGAGAGMGVGAGGGVGGGI